MKQTASMLDWGKQGLDPAVFDDQGKLKPEHKEHILSKLYKKLDDAGFQQYEEWMDTVHIIGSLTSYRYARATDIDIHPVVDLDKFLESEEQEMDYQTAADVLNELGKELSREETETLEGTKHEMEYYFETHFLEDGEQYWITLAETTEGDYDLIEDEWTKDPLFVDFDWDADTIYKTVLEEAQELAEDFDINIGEIKREIEDIELLDQSLQSFKGQSKQSKFFLEKIEEKIEVIEADILDMADKGEGAHDERVEQFEGNKEDLAKGIKFKYLQRYGYIWLYKQLQKLFEDETPPELTLDEIPQVKKIIKEFKMSENLFQILSVLRKQASYFKDEASYIESSVLKDLGMTPPSAGVVPVFVQGSTEGKEFISVVATDGELKGQRFKVPVTDLHKLSFDLDEFSDEYREVVWEYFMAHPEAKMDTIETSAGIRQAWLQRMAKNGMMEKEKDFNTFKQFFVDAQLSAVEDWFTERCPEVYAKAVELKKQAKVESSQIQDLYNRTIFALNEGVEKEAEGEECSECGQKIKTFMHNCPNTSNYVEMKGCPSCDDVCPECSGEEKKASLPKESKLTAKEIFEDGNRLGDWAMDYNVVTKETESNGGQEFLIEYNGKYYEVQTDWEQAQPEYWEFGEVDREEELGQGGFVADFIRKYEQSKSTKSPIPKESSSFNSGAAAVPAKKNSSLDSRTINWINSVLLNDEVSTDEELVEHFIKEGPMPKEQAEWWVGKRNEFLASVLPNDPDFEEEFERAFPDEAEKEASVVKQADYENVNVYEADADDLILLIDNTKEMYDKLVDMYKNLTRKKKSGKYDKTLAPKLFMYLVDEAAKVWYRDTTKWAGETLSWTEEKDGVKPSRVEKVTKAVKEQTAKEMVERFEGVYESKEYDFMKTEASIAKQADELPEDPLEAYLVAALWSTTDMNDEGADTFEALDENYSISDISERTKQKAKSDWESFLQKAGDLVKGLELNKVAMDFWLTRNHHGAGFWDTADYEEEIGKKLTEISDAFGGVDFYAGSDGKIYGSTDQKIGASMGKKSSSLGIEYQSQFTTEEKDSIRTGVCERIADVLLEGATQGEIYDELRSGKIVSGWFKVHIEKDENDEDTRNAEVARLIRKGNSSGYYPTFEWSANVWDTADPEVGKPKMKKKSAKKEQVLLSYDESDIAEAEVEFRMAEPGEFDYVLDKIEYEKEDGTTSDLWELYESIGKDDQKFIAKVKELGLWEEFEEKVRGQVYENPDFLQFAWQDLIEDLDSELKKRSPSGLWYAKGSNMGWMHREGDKSFKANDAKEWLNAILPDTDTSFDIYELPNNGLKMVVFHHDAPTGETYEIYPQEACAICGEAADKKIKNEWYCQNCAEDEGIWPKEKKAGIEHDDIVQMVQVDNNLFVAKDRDGHVKYQGTRDEVNKWIEDKRVMRGEKTAGSDSAFNEWFTTFLEEKGLAHQEWMIEDANGESNFIDSDVVIEAIQNASSAEQKKIKDMIVKIDFANGDVNDYFKHLAKGLAMTRSEKKKQASRYENAKEISKEEALELGIDALPTEDEERLIVRQVGHPQGDSVVFKENGKYYVAPYKVNLEEKASSQKIAGRWSKASKREKVEVVNGYTIVWNKFWEKFQVSHPEIGANLAEFDNKEDAIEFAKNGSKETVGANKQAEGSNQTKAEELAESFINGNISWVREQIGGDIKLFNAVMDALEEFDPAEVKTFKRLMTAGLNGQAPIRKKASLERKAELNIQITKEAMKSFKDIKELQKEVQDNDLHPGDYIKVGGVEYVMVEYSAISYKRPGGGGGSRYVTYADSDTLTKEINIDYEEKTVREDEAAIDWTEKIAPKIKKESEVVQAPPFKEWWVDNKMKPENKQQYDEYTKQETARGEKPRSYDEWASDAYDAMLEKSTTASLIKKSVQYRDLPEYDQLSPEEVEEAYRVMNIEDRIMDSMGMDNVGPLKKSPEKAQAYLEEIKKKIPGKVSARFYKFFENENYHMLNEALAKLDMFEPHLEGITYYTFKSEASLERKAYVEKVPGHKNSKGELAEWVIKSHETDKILSSHKTKEKAEKHLQDMHAHSGK